MRKQTIVYVDDTEQKIDSIGACVVMQQWLGETFVVSRKTKIVCFGPYRTREVVKNVADKR